MSKRKIFVSTLLVAGTAVGSGMLGLPFVTCKSGFFPGIVATIIVGLATCITGLLFAYISLEAPPGNNVIYLSKWLLGKGGSVVSGSFFIFLYYCLMVAYISIGAPFVGALFLNLKIFTTVHSQVTIFSTVFGLVVALGASLVGRANAVLSIFMILVWSLMVYSGLGFVSYTNLSHTNWGILSMTFPVLFSAYGFHNIVPSIRTYLKGDRSGVYASIAYGTGIAMVIYILWQLVILGTISFDAIAQQSSSKAIVEQLQHATGNKAIYTLSNLFIFFAISTSVLGVAFSMVDFIGDGLKIKKRTGASRFVLTLLVFLPPSIFTLLNPDGFMRALEVAGGIGEASLNGLMPVLMFWIIKRYHTKSPPRPQLPILGTYCFLFTLASFFLFVTFLEIRTILHNLHLL